MKRAAKSKRRWRFRGIVQDAAALGVHRNSLYKVLAGVRPGKSLLQRYSKLKEEQHAEDEQTNKTKN